MSVFGDSIVQVLRQLSNVPKFSANVAREGGGAVYSRESELLFDGTEFIGNKANVSTLRDFAPLRQLDC